MFADFRLKAGCERCACWDSLYAIASRRLNHRQQTASGSESRRKSSPLINFKTVIPSELTIGSAKPTLLICRSLLFTIHSAFDVR